jgi:hypothetical protein
MVAGGGFVHDINSIKSAQLQPTRCALSSSEADSYAYRGTIRSMICRSRRRPRILGPVTFLLPAVFGPALALAQEAVDSGAHVPAQIILPRKLVAGAPATLAVADAGGQLVPKVVVELSGGLKVTTDATGRGTFLAPKNAGTMTAQIAAPGITSFTFVVTPRATASAAAGKNSPDAVQILAYPRFISKSDKFAIEGTGFRGDVDTNRIALADEQCLVLASSPVSLVAFPGARVPTGAGNLSISIAGKGSDSIPVTVVQLEVSGSDEHTTVGAQGTLTIRARGAAESLGVDVVNKSPDIVELLRGAVQRLKTAGGETNIAKVAMKNLKSGDYVVTAQLVSVVSGQPDIESARQELIAARLAATGKWPGRLDAVLRRFNKKPPNAAKIRDDLMKMLRDMPPGQLAVLLDSAIQDIVRN